MRYKTISIVLLVLLGLGAGTLWLVQVNKQAHASQNALEASYQSNFFSLMENVENLDVLLGKILASNSSDQDIITLASAWSMAEVAKTNLDNLPLGTENMMRSNQYFTQLGDFCYSLAQKIACNQEITDSEWLMVRQQHQETRRIHNELRQLLGLMQEKQIRFGRLAFLNEELTPGNQDMLDGFGTLDERLQNEVPTLTYDGPFSDHVVNREPRGLSGQLVNDKEAKKAALQFAKNMGMNIEYEAETTGKTAGRIPSYSITLQPKDQNNSQLAFGISEKGGHVVLMVDAGERGQVKRINEKQAKEKAGDFVKKLGLGTFIPTGYLAEGNELLVNYALIKDDVIIYPDMIQVIVSLDSGNITAYDANKYLLSHTERKLPNPKITEAEARGEVNEKLEIEEIRLALIPMGNLKEKLTYEVKGKLDGETYFVYVNAETGFQEKILLIVETPQGTRSI